MIDPAGAFVIGREGGRLVLADRRPATPLQIIRSRTVVQARAIVPRLFGLYGDAHRIAFDRAVAAARATPEPVADDRTLEDHAVLFGHAWRFAVTWPIALGLPPRTECLRRVRAALAERQRTVAAAGILALIDAPTGPVAVMEGRTLDWDLPLPPAPDHGSRNAADWSGLFATDRRAGQVMGHGTGSIPLRRPLDLTMAAIRSALVAVEDGLPQAGALQGSDGAGAGIGLAETARGPLAYRVVLDGDRVVEAEAISPTDWLARPDGVLAAALAALPSDAGAIEAIRVLTALYDPGVALHIDLREPAHA